MSPERRVYELLKTHKWLTQLEIFRLVNKEIPYEDITEILSYFIAREIFVYRTINGKTSFIFNQ